jgi:hypothetical protein
MRTTAAVGFVLLVLASLASAQIPTSGNVFVGYSYFNAGLPTPSRISLNGWEASLEGKVLPWVGIVADFSGHYGSPGFACAPPPPQGINGCELNGSLNERNVLFGPRLSISLGKIRPFGEALFGIGHIGTTSVGSDNSLATAVGGGLDYRVIKLIAVRVQGDYIQTRFFGATQNNVRISTGVVLRF